MTWDEVADGVGCCPVAQQDRPRTPRPLSGAALSIVKAHPRIADVPYIFTAGERPLRGVWRMKADLDAATGVTGWTIHDLRRTAAVAAVARGVSADVAERCIGHVIGGVRGTYDQAPVQAEMLHAFEALAALLERIVGGPQANVVALRGSRQ